MEIMRRELLKGAALGAGALAAAGAAGAAMAAEAGDRLVTLPESWDLEADVVVLGFGHAGQGAAVAAQEAGLSVLVLEKMEEAYAGGASCCYGGLLNPKDSEYLEFATYGAWDKARCDEIGERSIAAAEWMAGLAEETEDFPYNGRTVQRAPEGGIVIYNAIAPEVAARDGITVEYGLAAKRLISDAATREVLGVVAERDGAELNVKANRGVVIATGGYEENRDLMQGFHYPCLQYATFGGPSRTGDGLVMAAEIGAKVGNLCQSIEWNPYALRAASEEVGSGVILDANGVGGGIYVNLAGERFDVETHNLSHNKTTLPALDFYGEPTGLVDHTRGYQNLPMWAVWDADMLEDTPVGLQSPYGWANIRLGVEWDNDEAVEKGWLIKADTIEELAAQMTSTNFWGEPVAVDAAGLAATIEAYNGYAEAGEDPDFGRSEQSLKPLATPPFYAAELMPCVLYTIGGLMTNGSSQVLDWQDQPIPRLYAAGDVGQGVLWTPLGVCGCYAEGAIAGEQIAQLDAWA